MTFALIKSCRKKSRLLKAYKKTGSSLSRNTYIVYKNTLKQALRHAEKTTIKCNLIKRPVISKNLETYKLFTTQKHKR